MGLLGRFIAVWKMQNGHTHTRNYCNPAERSNVDPEADQDSGV